MSEKVALYSTCLVNSFKPSIITASKWLLEVSGFNVSIPEAQTCCGQPGYNNGDTKTAKKLATRVIKSLQDYDFIVLPSGSCADMIINHYPKLFADETNLKEAAENVAAKTHELVSFISLMGDKESLAYALQKGGENSFNGAYTYHDSCTGYNSLGIKNQVRELLAMIKNAELKEMKNSSRCCGFGGTFCIKYNDISKQMASDKIEEAKKVEAQAIIGGDLGCLLNIQGTLSRQQKDIQTMHIAEFLAAGRYSKITSG